MVLCFMVEMAASTSPASPHSSLVLAAHRTTPSLLFFSSLAIFLVNMVFPFCLAMVRGFDIPLAWEGVAAGGLAAGYSAGQVLSGKLWGKVSDRIGRKIVIVGGLAAASVCMLLFGLANSFTVAFLARLLGGAFNGFTGIVKVSGRRR